MTKLWTKKDLEAATESARSANANLPDKVHQAALACARLHGQTDEQNIDRQVVKAELDALMDELQHDDIWNAREVQTLEIMRNLAMYKRERETVPEIPFRGRSGRGRDNDGR